MTPAKNNISLKGQSINGNMWCKVKGLYPEISRTFEINNIWNIITSNTWNTIIDGETKQFYILYLQSRTVN